MLCIILPFCVAEQGFHLTVLAVEGVIICGCDSDSLKPKNLWLIENQGKLVPQEYGNTKQNMFLYAGICFLPHIGSPDSLCKISL